MDNEIKQFNPVNYIFSYNLGPYDCYALRKGICSLYLSKEEAGKIFEEEKGQSFGEGSVMSCRILANQLLEVDYYKDPKFQQDNYSIRMYEQTCGHFVFDDGQHRTCIAKHLNINSMYANITAAQHEFQINCYACIEKEKTKNEQSKLINRIKKLFLFKRPNELPHDFLDEEYMEFNKDIIKVGNC